MTTDFTEKLAAYETLADALAPLVSRGAMHHFYLSPLLPQAPVAHDVIREAWRGLLEDIARARVPDKLTWYLHIPFCEELCTYCIYYRVSSADRARIEAYLDRIHAEIDYYAPLFRQSNFVAGYIGGGTPTCLSAPQTEKLLNHLREAFPKAPGGEWSFESSPYTLDDEKASLFASAGFNRASFGVQTTRPDTLTAVNRGMQDIDQVREALSILRRYDFFVNVDLIQGLPGEDMTDTLRSLETILALAPSKVTHYVLSPYTPRLGNLGPVRSIAEMETAIRPLAQRFGYDVTPATLCVNLERREKNRLRRDLDRFGRDHRYADTAHQQQSLLALGPSARGYAFGRYRYQFMPYPVDDPFDPSAPVATGRPLSREEEQRRYVTYRLSHHGAIGQDDYARIFGEPLETLFGQELSYLLAEGRLAREGETLIHTTDNPRHRFITECFFVSDDAIEAARRDVHHGEKGRDDWERSAASDAVESRLVRLRLRDRQITAWIFQAGEGKKHFHAAGGFAFRLASEHFEPNGDLHREARAPSIALTKLFDLVVSFRPPASLDELHRRLLEVGKNLASRGVTLL